MAPFPLSLPGHDFRVQRQNGVKAKEVNYALFKPCCGKELRFIQEIFYLLLPNCNYFTQEKVSGVGNEFTLDGLDLFPSSCHTWLVFLSKCRKHNPNFLLQFKKHTATVLCQNTSRQFAHKTVTCFYWQPYRDLLDFSCVGDDLLHDLHGLPGATLSLLGLALRLGLDYLYLLPFAHLHRHGGGLRSKRGEGPSKE